MVQRFGWVAPAILVLLTFAKPSAGWDSEDLEVFDVVEEVGQNFYELLGVPPNADSKAIKKAFRALSLTLHPDKNAAADAEIKFRQLVSVHDILRDANKRAKYDDVLINGLPDWKQAIYYYRRVRKMGLMEMSIILFIIVTIGQYCVAWAAYFEKKYAIEEFVRFKSKKIQKKQKKGKPVDETEARMIPDLMNSLPKPSVTCTLPVQIFRLSWFLIVDAPPLTYHWVRTYFEERAQAATEQAEESSEEEEVYVPRERGPRRRKGFQVPEVTESSENHKDNTKGKERQPPKKSPPPTAYASGPWTDDDFLDLIRLMKKFPPGTNERWEKIGVAMKRAPHEVAHFAHKMKDEGFKPVVVKEEEPEVVPEVPKKVKTRSTVEVEESPWSPSQQKALEAALAVNPKGSTGDRWARIAASVPGKSRDECIVRYKKIHEAVKKKKEEVNDCGPEEAAS
uniref:DnaJ subfamily C member 1 n=1 Tax=Lygus hesperus TaxID=30085 RepID=A0A0A9ZHK8_LYGHE